MVSFAWPAALAKVHLCPPNPYVSASFSTASERNSTGTPTALLNWDRTRWKSKGDYVAHHTVNASPVTLDSQLILVSISLPGPISSARVNIRPETDIAIATGAHS